MKKADWILDYDMHTDSTYRRPGCPKCNVPVGSDGKCYSCGKEYWFNDKMRKWFDDRAGEKVETEDCWRCGGVGTVEMHCRKNHVTCEWQAAWGHCTKCGMRFIV